MHFNEIIEKIRSEIDPEKRYKHVVRTLSENGYFSVLIDWDYSGFLEKLKKLSEIDGGAGIAVALMAQVNTAGFVLKHEYDHFPSSPANQVLNTLIQGEAIVSFGVSEPGWGGSLKNLETCESEENGIPIFTLKKSFLTNGLDCNYILAVGKNSQKKSSLYLVPSNQIGSNYEKFTLPYMREATHIKVDQKITKFDQIKILNSEYTDVAPYIRVLEGMSLCAVFIGFSRFILQDCILELDENKEGFILRVENFLSLLESKLEELGKLTTEKKFEEVMASFPFGYEEVVNVIKQELDQILVTPVLEKYPDFGIFLWEDSVQKKYKKRKISKMIEKYKIRHNSKEI